MYTALDAPLSVHLELTSSCNYKCSHCYNFWRSSEDISSDILTTKLATNVINKLHESGVFHVILTGGEPMMNMDVLIFTMKELAKRNISFSLNSNASLMTEERAEVFREAGLRTIMVSLLSYDRKTQDLITNRNGSYERTIQGIKHARIGGLRVAVNMVVSRTNLSHVVDTGLFAKNLGAFAFSATRVMPPRQDMESVAPEFVMDSEVVRSIMNQMVELKDSGLQLESLVPYPSCFFDTVEEAQIFGGRTCSAGKTSCAIGADGFVRACAHHEEKYGNLGSESLSAIWKRMEDWRDGSLLPPECKTCTGIASCGGGCRIATPGKSLCKKDPIMQKPEDFRPKIKERTTVSVSMESMLRVRKQCRFRDDKAMGIINTEGIKNTFVGHDTLNLFRESSKKQSFSPDELKLEHSIEMSDSDYLRFLADLIDRNVLELIT